jgi:hypothetical protein
MIAVATRNIVYKKNKANKADNEAFFTENSIENFTEFSRKIKFQFHLKEMHVSH